MIAYGCITAGRLALAAASAPWIPTTITFVVTYFILNLGQGLTHTLLKALMSAAASEDTLGLMLGVLSSTDKLVGVVAPLLGGPTYDRLGPAAPACLSGMIAFCGCVAAATLVIEPSKQPRTMSVSGTAVRYSASRKKVD